MTEQAGMMSDRNILLITNRAPDYGGIVAGQGIKDRFHWIYLGKDYSELCAIEKAFNERGTRIIIGDRLQELAREFRQDYIDFIGSLRPEHESLGWWASSVSEKNPFATNLFLYFCYVKLALEALPKVPGDLVIICENKSLGKVIANHCPGNAGRLTVITGSAISAYTGAGIKLVRKGVKKGWFVARFLSRILLARMFRIIKKCREKRAGHAAEDPILVHSWTDARSFSPDGRFENIYFRGLMEELERQDRPFLYLIDVLPTMFYPVVLVNLMRENDNTRLLEEYLSFWDVIRALSSMRLTPAIDIRHSILKGVQLSLVISEEFENDTLMTRREESYLKYLSTQAIAARLHPSHFVYLFENHVWEKMFLAGFRNHSPETKTTGYVHTIVREMYTCYSVSENEEGHIPLPDTIVVSGSHAGESLARSGIPSDRIRVGGALRYPSILISPGIPVPASPDKKTVLIALSAGFNESLELLMKGLQAASMLDISVIIKCHPLLPFDTIVPYAGNLNGNFTVSDEPVEKILKKTDLLLYSETTVCVEALALGIPVVHVRSDCRIDMNILEDLPSVKSERDPEQINKAILDGLSRPDHTPLPMDQLFVRALLSPVRPDLVDIFLAPRTTGSRL